MKPTIAIAVLWLAFTASSQSPPPGFDAAEVRVSKVTMADAYDDMEAGRVEFRGTTMLDILAAAYNVTREQVLGGPSWLDTNRFDITARAPRDTPDEGLRKMLQGLLAERFKLEIRKEERPMPVFVLTVSKRGLKLKKSSADGAVTCDEDNSHQPNVGIVCKNAHAAEIGKILRLRSAGYVNHAVVDDTGLKDAYNFSLNWTVRGQLARTDNENKISLPDALEKQLGLKIEAATRPLKVILVDKVNEKPTDDGKTVTKALPPPPTAFEVATIRPIRPDSTKRESRFLPSGEIEWFGATLKEMIQQAYNIDGRDSELISGPKWIGTDRFDLIAKTQQGVPLDAVQVMLQNLLKERFKLAAHVEPQPVNVYAITATKQIKMKAASPDERSQCVPGTGDGFRTFTCQNITMAQLAEKIRTTAGGYLDHPVVNLTELSGAYDFTLRWTGKQNLNANAAPGVGTASDPNGAISLWEAVDKQLGLKLAPQKYPMSVYVIDHVEQKPVEN